MASGKVTVRGRHKPEKTAVRAVSEQMAPDFNGVARFEVLLFDADPLEPAGARCFHSPDCGLPFSVRDFDVEPGMRHQQMHFRDLAFHGRPFRYVVVAVGMVCQSRQDQENRTHGREPQRSD